MSLKRLILILGLMGSAFSIAYGVWDVTTPAGTESRSLGDDRIREFKTDIQTALQYEGDFPGSDTSNPKFIYTPSYGTNANRPSSPVTGQLFLNNLSSGTIERYSGTAWETINTVGNAADGHGIMENSIQSSVAGYGIVGGSGTPLSINYDDKIFTIETDSITLTATPVINSSSTINGYTIFNGTVQFNQSTQPSFLVEVAGENINLTGNAVTRTVTFQTEVFDVGDNVSNSTFTAPSSGYYLMNCSILLSGLTTSSHNTPILYLVTSEKTYTFEQSGNSAITAEFDHMQASFSTLVHMTAGDTAYVQVSVSAGSQDVDILGTTTFSRTSIWSGTKLF